MIYILSVLVLVKYRDVIGDLFVFSRTDDADEVNEILKPGAGIECKQRERPHLRVVK